RLTGRPTRQSHAALGVGGARAPGGGPPVRSLVLGRGSGEHAPREDLHRQSQSAFARSAARLSRRAGPRVSDAGPQGAIRAARLELVTAGKLHVLHFKSRALGAERSVRVWLPSKFSKRTTYSVLYLNDGQNLFGDGDPDSGGGGWHVDETAARLIEEQRVVPLIVVGIDNGGERARGIDYLPVPDAFSEDPDPTGAADTLRFATNPR